MLSVCRLEQPVGVVVEERLGLSVEDELLVADAQSSVGQVCERGAIVTLFDVAVGLLARTDAVEEVKPVWLSVPAAVFLSNDFAIFFEDLPASTMRAEVHHPLGAVDFYSRWALRPVGKFIAITDIRCLWFWSCRA